MALCTLSDLKSWLGIDTLDTSKDTILTMIINATSKKIEGYCGTKLEFTTVTDELLEGSGNTNSIILNNIFVNQVDKIEFLVNEVWETVYDSTLLIDTHGLTLDKENGIIKLNTIIPSITQLDVLTMSRINNVKYPNIRVTYKCGFNPIPSDLMLVCLKQSARSFTNEVGGKLLVKKESVLGASEEYDTNLNNSFSLFMQDELNTLNDYKRWI